MYESRTEALQRVGRILHVGDELEGARHVAEVVLHAQVRAREVLGVLHDLAGLGVVRLQPL
jgi:hypothetical protein